jgi:hypothetical protein
VHVHRFNNEVAVHHICLASNGGALFEDVAGTCLATKKGTAGAWQGFTCMLFVVVPRVGANLVVWESPGDSRHISFLSGHASSVAMCPMGFFFAQLQLKHHGAQLQPRLAWHQQHLDLCSLRMWPVRPQAMHLCTSAG